MKEKFKIISNYNTLIKYLIKWLWIVLLLIIPDLVWSQNVYRVNDNNSISNILNFVTAGDVIIMSKDGNWHDQDIIFAPKSQGTAFAPITLTCEPGTTLTGGSSIKLMGEYLIIDGLTFSGNDISNTRHLDRATIQFGLDRLDNETYAHNSRITNISFLSYNPSDHGEVYHYVRLLGQYNQVDHCLFENKFGLGSTVQIDRKKTKSKEIDGHLINYNYFKSRRMYEDTSQEEAIQIGNARREATADSITQANFNDSQSTIEHNLFFDQDGELEIISIKSDNNVVRYNTFRKCAGSITLRHGHGSKIYGNFIFGENDENSGGITVLGENHEIYNNYIQNVTDFGIRLNSGCNFDAPCSGENNDRFAVKTLFLAHNTIIDSKNSLVIGSDTHGTTIPPEGSCNIWNNIICNYVSLSDVLIKTTDNVIDLNYQKNLVFLNSLDQIIELFGIPSGIITDQDPQLIYNGDFYKLSPMSPAIDAAYGQIELTDLNGTSESKTFDLTTDLASKEFLVTEDIEGQDRGLLKDIGADEYQDEQIMIALRPYTSEDVGPKKRYSIKWTDLVNVDAESDLIKVSNLPLWDAGAASLNVIPEGEDGWIEFRLTEDDKNVMFGLSSTNLNSSWKTIEYNFYISPHRGGLKILNNGITIVDTFGAFEIGDVFRIEKEKNGEIRFLQNEVIHFSMSMPNSDKDLIADIALLDPGAKISYAACSHDASLNKLKSNARIGSEFIRTDTDHNFLVSPNPTNSILMFSSTLIPSFQVKIISLSGRIEQEYIIDEPNEQIDIKDLPNGIYLIVIKEKLGKTQNARFIKSD